MDSACAWDGADGTLNIFAINKNPEAAYTLDIDVSAFPGYAFEKHTELYSEDFERKNSYETPDAVTPRENKGASCRDGILNTDLKPLSWNLFCFKKLS